MYLIFGLFLLLPIGLFGQQAMGDTLWVARHKPTDRTAEMVILPGWKMVSSNPDDSTCKKVNIICRAIVRDSTGKVTVLSSRVRLVGMDTSKVELKYTTVDTLPGRYEPTKFKLDPSGKFQKK